MIPSLLADLFQARVPVSGSEPSFLILVVLLGLSLGLLVVMILRPFVVAWRQYRAMRRLS